MSISIVKVKIHFSADLVVLGTRYQRRSGTYSSRFLPSPILNLRLRIGTYYVFQSQGDGYLVIPVLRIFY